MKFEVSIKGDTYIVEVEKCSPLTMDEFQSYGGNSQATATTESVAPQGTAPQSNSVAGNTINAPLPGSIVAVKVTVGQSVKKGQVVAILEAMKMENEVVAPEDGTVKAIIAPKGTNVVVGDPIIEIG